MNPSDFPVTQQSSAAPIARRERGYWGKVARTVLRDPVTAGCLVVLVLMIVAAAMAPWLGLADPYQTSVLQRLKPPGTPGHLLGTDELGRDMLSRLVHGARLSLTMGIVPVAVALLVGGMLGITAGFCGGRVNTLIMRVADVFFAFPSILLAVAIAGALGAGLANSMLAITVVFIPPITRVAETVTTQIRNMDYVEAARASGASAFAIVRTHILGNVLGPIFVYATCLVSVSIVIAAGISFIGLGASPPAAEWGLMLNTLRSSIYVAPVTALLPGVMIFIASMCFNLLSDGLRSAMDVRL